MQTSRCVNDENVTTGIDGLAPRFFRESFDGSSIRFADLALVDVGLDRLRDNL